MKLDQLRKFSRTFLWQLSVSFFTTSFVLFFAFCYFFRTYWVDFTDRAKQLVNWEIAEEYARYFAPLLAPEINTDAVEQRIYGASLTSPEHEIYILDKNGRTLFPTSAMDVNRYPLVPTEGIKDFVEQTTIPENALYAINPGYTPTDRVVFSAAKIQIGSESGYLLVILSSRRSQASQNMVGDLSAVSAVMLFAIIGLVVSSTLGLSLFYLLTRRFARMTSVLREFRGGNFERRLVVKSRDELGEHAETINQMADRIVESMQAVKDLDAARRELIAGVAHDLRTPVAVMLIALETLANDAPTVEIETLQARIKPILRSCESLDLLVTDLFELSKLGAENFKLSCAKVVVEDFINGIHELFSSAASANQIRLLVSDVDPSWVVSVDPHLLERAVGNLVKNALDYTPPGGEVQIQALRIGSSVRLVIADTGIGISAADLPNVFDRFFRASAAAKTSAGTGLGLAIVKKIIELHQSKILVSSLEGAGTTFSFELPLV